MRYQEDIQTCVLVEPICQDASNLHRVAVHRGGGLFIDLITSSVLCVGTEHRGMCDERRR